MPVKFEDKFDLVVEVILENPASFTKPATVELLVDDEIVAETGVDIEPGRRTIRVSSRGLKASDFNPTPSTSNNKNVKVRTLGNVFDCGTLTILEQDDIEMKFISCTMVEP